MDSVGKTIRLFLVNGDPSDFVIGEIFGWTGRIMSFPRSLLPKLLAERKEIGKTGVYFLIGQDADNETSVYIGKSENLDIRLCNHGSQNIKDFERIAFYHSKDENITAGHAGYLENKLIKLAEKVGKVTTLNKNHGSEIRLPESDICFMENEIKQIVIIMSALGYDFLKEDFSKPRVSDSTDSPLEERTVFKLTRQDPPLEAKAFESDGQFIVMKGSHARHPDEAKPSRKKSYLTRIEGMKNEGTLVNVGGSSRLLEFRADVAFSSPTLAAETICGTSVNGREEWKVADTNQTYNEWYAQKLDALDGLDS